MSYNLYDIQIIKLRSHVFRKDLISPLLTTCLIDLILKISVNTLAQKNITNKIKKTEKKFIKLEQIYDIIIDSQLQYNIYIRIKNL